MIRRPPRSTLDRSSAASDVYKRQFLERSDKGIIVLARTSNKGAKEFQNQEFFLTNEPVSYTHLRAHETVLDLVCRLLLEKKKNLKNKYYSH